MLIEGETKVEIKKENRGFEEAIIKAVLQGNILLTWYMRDKYFEKRKNNTNYTRLHDKKVDARFLGGPSSQNGKVIINAKQVVVGTDAQIQTNKTKDIGSEKESKERRINPTERNWEFEPNEGIDCNRTVEEQKMLIEEYSQI